KVSNGQKNTQKSAEHYLAQLNQDFAKLLKERSGMSFSFSMKPMEESGVLSLDLERELGELASIIDNLLKINSIGAQVRLSQYKTPSHRFAVYFIDPQESNAAKNKELIAALRQVINGCCENIVVSPINIFLVLANAKTIIEDHLAKIGAQKIDD
ncbi:MAG: hypothetical protein KC505_09450, partial [Myxococcales bacterium]|nr:hypothetical protein [Myxococcales bacterium]